LDAQIPVIIVQEDMSPFPGITMPNSEENILNTK
jgi:hypothetical protein